MGVTNSSKIVSELFEDEAVVVNLVNGSYYSFRSAALEIWKMAEAGYNREQIISACENQDACKPFLDYLLTEALAMIDDIPALVPSENKIQGIPEYSKYEDMKDLLLLDPIHEVDQSGWPNKLPE